MIIKKKIAIWSGIYKNFKSTGYKSTNHHFYSNEYLKIAKKRFNNSVSKGQSLSLFNLLLILIKKNRSINVLDFGGGIGESIARLNIDLIYKKKINFFLFDNKKLITQKSYYLKKIFKNSECKIKFVDSFTNIKSKFDVVLFASVVQYIEKKNLDKIICEISKKHTKYIIFEDLFLSQKSFVSLQKFYSHHEIPFKFYTKIELFNILKKYNYSPLFYDDRQPSSSTNNFYSMNNFPKEYRIERSKNAVFIKI